MSDTHPGLRPCRQCRLTFTSGRSLRRHERMDHRSATDGAALTALLVGGGRPSASEPRVRAPADGPATATRLADRPTAVPDRAPSPAPGPARAGPLPALALLALALLAFAVGPVPALVVIVLAWSRWVRWHVLLPRAAQPPPDGLGPTSP